MVLRPRPLVLTSALVLSLAVACGGSSSESPPVDQNNDNVPDGLGSFIDANGDGFADVIVGTTGGIKILPSTLTGTTTKTWSGLGSATSVGTDNVTAITVGDVNGDKKADIVVATTGATAKPTVYLQGASWTPVALGATAANSSAVTLADVNGDKQLDVVVAYGTNITVYKNTTTPGTFDGGTAITVTATALAAGDIDGDGQLDVVAASTDRSPDYSDILMAFHASGSPVQGFPPIESQTIGCDARRSDDAECWIVGAYDQNLAIGDLDGDGSQDIVSPMDNSYAGFYHGTGEAFDANPMFEGRPKTPGVRYMHDLELAQQGFGDSSDLQAYFKNSAPAIADLDGDGTPEIIMLGAAEDVDMSDQSQGVGLWVVRNDASRIEGWESPFYAPDYLSGGEDLGGNIVAMTQQVTVADLDATHAGPEMIFAGLDGRIHAVYADKTEFWDVTYTDDTQVLTGGVVVGDLSGDGIPEVVFNTYSTEEGRSHLFVLDAGGTILHQIPLPRLGAMPVPTLADVNGDGTIEIVVSLREIGWDGADPEPNTYVYTVPGSATNCLLWPTGRGNLFRNAWVR